MRHALYFILVICFMLVTNNKYKLIAFCWANAVYKYNDYVHHAAITTFYLLQQDVYNYFVYKHHLPDAVTYWRLERKVITVRWSGRLLRL